jgi:NAD(P)-dependent dehydrogenase (short-subunit alcohol dehydrogenase family)
MERGLGGKDALVTSASGGSGATRVRAFAAEGAAGLLLSLQNGNNRVPSAAGASVLPEVEQE